LQRQIDEGVTRESAVRRCARDRAHQPDRDAARASTGRPPRLRRWPGRHRDAIGRCDDIRADVALYKPENGPALNLFGGLHVHPYVSIQANYVWNRNNVTLFSSVVSAGASGFFEQRRDSDQHAVIADALLYFRRRGDAIRPYLSTGVGMVRFQSNPGRTMNGGLLGPEGELSSTRVALRVAVGIDLAIRDAWSFRYSFSETISGNPISTRLTPPGERNLANFQNLFGIVRRF
jgi:hypothetical protein